MIPEIDCSGLARAWRDGLKDDPPVLLVGSPISEYAPSSLPAGGEVSRQLLNLLFPDAAEWLQRGFLEIPFEGLMEACPDQASLPTIIASVYSDTPHNRLHDVLADALVKRRIAALLTTNYDCAIEAAIGPGGPDLTIPYDDVGCTAVLDGDLPGPLYFKIHGSAAPDNPRALSSIVFRLRQEGRLTEPKRTLLARTLAARRLLVLLYSGRDWELCPEIALSTTPSGVWWLRPGIDPQENELSPNAVRVLKRHNGVVVVGDAQNLIRDLFAPSLPVSRRSDSLRSIAARFPKELIPEWRIHILDRLACPSLGLRLLGNPSEQRTVRLQVARSNMLAHMGKYKQAARAAAQIAHSAPMDRSDRLALHLVIAERWLCYGAPLRCMLWMIKVVWRPFHQPQNSDLRGSVQRITITLLRKLTEMFTAVGARRATTTFIKPVARRLYKGAVELLGDQGKWEELQMVQDEGERLGIADSALLPLNSAHGYQALGHQGLQSGRLRRTHSNLTASELASKVTAIRLAIEKAEIYGWHHEAWKHLAALYYTLPSERKQTFDRWRYHFCRTEYPWLRRVLLALPVLKAELIRRFRRRFLPASVG